jgi:hypothetical protein
MLLIVAIVSQIYHAAQLELADIVGINARILPTVNHVIHGFEELAKAMIPETSFLLC